jgi:hypothetical protein
MNIWSKGLGTMVLNMDFRHYYVEIRDGNLLIKGQIVTPVMWYFQITVGKDDIRGLANILFKGRFLAFLGRNIRWFGIFFHEKLFKRKKFDHPEKTIELPADVYSIESPPGTS